MQVTNSLSLGQTVAENTMTANKVLIAVIAFVVLAKAYVILTS
ncbi:hypothetical protein N9769_06635 [Ascidiaceihabitans sp.]|nr:hypothetical protein [Ascidiaceihabitans sp.]